MAGWDKLPILIELEITQRKEEGYVVDGFYEKLNVLKHDEDKLMALYKEMKTAPVKKDYPFYEPSELEEIIEERPKYVKGCLSNK